MSQNAYNSADHLRASLVKSMTDAGATYQQACEVSDLALHAAEKAIDALLEVARRASEPPLTVNVIMVAIPLTIDVMNNQMDTVRKELGDLLTKTEVTPI